MKKLIDSPFESNFNAVLEENFTLQNISRIHHSGINVNDK